MKSFLIAVVGLVASATSLGCNRTVVTTSGGLGGAGGATSVTSNGTTSNASSSKATTSNAVSSNAATTNAATSGSGGTCVGWIDMAVDNSPPVHWATICNNSWGAQWTMSADGYIFAGGPAPGIEGLDIGGCQSAAPNATGVHLAAPNVMGPGTYTMGSTQYIDPMGSSWGVQGDSFKLTITKLDPVGGYIDGIYSGFVSKGGNAAHSLSAKFHVCRVNDELAP